MAGAPGGAEADQGRLTTILLGILHEAILAFSRHDHLNDFWRAVCDNARWILPTPCMCVLLEDEDGSYRLTARRRLGALEVLAAPSPVSPGARLRKALHTREARWLDLAQAREDQGLLAELLGTEASEILVVPLRGRERRIGTMLLGIAEAASFDRRQAGSLATVYSLHVGLAYSLIETRQKLLETQQRAATILEAAPDCVITMDHRGLIVDVNPETTHTFGYERDEVIGMEMAEAFVPPALRTRHRRGLERYLASGEGYRLGRRSEVTAMRRDGTEFPAEMSLLRIPGVDPPLFTAFVRDISERKQIERLKSEFVSTVSHELRTPLTSIRGAIGLLAAGLAGALPETAAELVAVALRNSERLILLVNDILDLEKAEAGKLEMRPVPLILTEVVDTTLSCMWPVAREAGVRLVSHAPEDVVIDGDRDRLVQVLTNLVANGIKFSPPGARLEVRVLRDGVRVRVEVVDQGPGIPEAQQPLLFQRFQQLDGSDRRVYGGTGLGLAICKTIVELHGGHIGVESTPGRGSTFFFELPISAGPARLQGL
ncbi:MAG TPA: ATP-binding protein [Polyangia bacterium]|nr:ATP-binding protein [Polyangia bacterium]